MKINSKAVICFYYNFLFSLITQCFCRISRIVKLSSPNINNVLLLGCFLKYSTVFMKPTDHGMEGTVCKVRGTCLFHHRIYPSYSDSAISHNTFPKNLASQVYFVLMCLKQLDEWKTVYTLIRNFIVANVCRIILAIFLHSCINSTLIDSKSTRCDFSLLDILAWISF